MDTEGRLSNHQTCEPYLKECFKNIRQNARVELAKKGLINLHGRHNPINYKNEYGFHESWESDRP